MAKERVRRTKKPKLTAEELGVIAVTACVRRHFDPSAEVPEGVTCGLLELRKVKTSAGTAFVLTGDATIPDSLTR